MKRMLAIASACVAMALIGTTRTSAGGPHRMGLHGMGTYGNDYGAYSRGGPAYGPQVARHRGRIAAGYGHHNHLRSYRPDNGYHAARSAAYRYPPQAYRPPTAVGRYPAQVRPYRSPVGHHATHHGHSNRGLHLDIGGFHLELGH